MDRRRCAIRGPLALWIAALVTISAAAQEAGTFPPSPSPFYQPFTFSGWLFGHRWEILAGAAVLLVHGVAAWIVVQVVRRRGMRRRLMPVGLGRHQRVRQRRRPDTGTVPVVPKKTA